MMEAVRQLQHDKSKSVAKAAQETFLMLQHVNARSYIPTANIFPAASAASSSVLFSSPPLSTPSPPLAELPAWPSEPPRACDELQRRSNFQEALCLFSEVAGLPENTIQLPLPPVAAPEHAATTASTSLTSLLRRPRARVSPPGMLTRPPQFLPLNSPPPKLKTQIVIPCSAPSGVSQDSAPADDFTGNCTTVATAQSDVFAPTAAASIAGDGHTSAAIFDAENGAPGAQALHPLARAPESPVLAAVSSSPMDELPPIPSDWSCCALDPSPVPAVAGEDCADDGATGTWCSEFTDAEVSVMLREMEHDAFSPVAAPAHVAEHPTLPATPATSAANCVATPSHRPRALRVGIVLGGAVVFAAFSVLWRACDFDSIV
jgi:hypothetical protein